MKTVIRENSSISNDVRGHSTTTWTEVCHFLAPPPAWTKTDDYLTPSPLILFTYVVIEWPLIKRAEIVLQRIFLVLLGSDVLFPSQFDKSQLISKRLFGILNSSKKQTKTIRPEVS